MSLTADVGVMYYQWMQLRKAVDASALAGATFCCLKTQRVPCRLRPSISDRPEHANVAQRLASLAIQNRLRSKFVFCNRFGEEKLDLE